MRWAGVIPLAALIALYGAPAAAQLGCGSRVMIVHKLIDQYGEVRVGFGMFGSRQIFEVWASKEKGTWTILRTTPNGISCLMASGIGWRFDPDQPKGDPT